MGILMLKHQEAAIQQAHEIVRDFDVSDMAYNASELTAKLEVHNRIMTAIDPRHPERMASRKALYEIIKAELPTAEGKEALRQYCDHCTDDMAMREILYFYLGWAMAMKAVAWTQQIPPTLKEHGVKASGGQQP